MIFNEITKSGSYPRRWVTEYVTPIPKVNPPESENEKYKFDFRFEQGL